MPWRGRAEARPQCRLPARPTHDATAATADAAHRAWHLMHDGVGFGRAAQRRAVYRCGLGAGCSEQSQSEGEGGAQHNRPHGGSPGQRLLWSHRRRRLAAGDASLYLRLSRKPQSAAIRKVGDIVKSAAAINFSRYSGAVHHSAGADGGRRSGTGVPTIVIFRRMPAVSPGSDRRHRQDRRNQVLRSISLRCHSSAWVQMVARLSKRGVQPSASRIRREDATISAGSPGRRGA